MTAHSTARPREPYPAVELKEAEDVHHEKRVIDGFSDRARLWPARIRARALDAAEDSP